MASAHYYYFHFTVSELERRVTTHQENFEEFLNDTFSDDELSGFEKMLDSIAALFVQPILSELSFDDFYADQSTAAIQREFFEACKSSICIENLPDFHTNPFQVSYLLQLLEGFNEVLIDQGGVHELVFKGQYVDELRGHKNIDSLISSPLERPLEVKTAAPVFPIDFLLLDVYRELDRLRSKRLIYPAMEQMVLQPEKTQKIFNVMKEHKLDGDALFKRSGLNPKDFDDNLERLKFFLKKIV